MRRDRALTVAEKMDARDALALLEGSGLSLLAAAQMAMGRSSASVPTQIEAAADMLIRDNIKRRLRASTLAFYEERLRVFLSSWPEAALLDDVSRADLLHWLTALPGSDGTRRATFRAISRLFAFALECEPPLCRVNPCEHLKLPVIKSTREIEILSVEDSRAIMAAACLGDGRYIAALALMLFAGIRPMEIRCKGKPALSWAHVDFRARSIRIPAEISKTHTARICEHMPANLWSWLRHAYARAWWTARLANRRSGIQAAPICSSMIRQAQRLARDAINQDNGDARECNRSK